MKFMKLKKALRKAPPTTDPKWYFKRRLVVRQIVTYLWVYHWVAKPDIIKLTKNKYKKYMNLLEIATPK